MHYEKLYYYNGFPHGLNKNEKLAELGYSDGVNREKRRSHHFLEWSKEIGEFHR